MILILFCGRYLKLSFLNVDDMRNVCKPMLTIVNKNKAKKPDAMEGSSFRFVFSIVTD